MKSLLLITVVSIALGTKFKRLRWGELLIIAAFIAAIVGWETFNILFRYIGVE